MNICNDEYSFMNEYSHSVCIQQNVCGKLNIMCEYQKPVIHVNYRLFEW